MANGQSQSDGRSPSLTKFEHDFAHHAELPKTRISCAIDAVIDRIGALVSWLWLIAVGVIMYSVVSRYVFARGSVMSEEVQWHLAGAAWLVGLSYTWVHDDHVRVDVLHERFSLKMQAWIELLGILLLLLPFLVLILLELMPYVASSFAQGERSQAPNGLPWRWALKSVMPIAVGLLIFASVSRLLRCSSLVLGFPASIRRPQASPSSEV